LDQELIPCRHLYCCCCCCCFCWGDAVQSKKSKAPSFRIGSWWNLAGLLFK